MIKINNETIDLIAKFNLIIEIRKSMTGIMFVQTKRIVGERIHALRVVDYIEDVKENKEGMDAHIQMLAEKVCKQSEAKRRAEEMKENWQPAETAPKDGEEFLAKNADGQRKIVFWDGSEFVDPQECMKFCVNEWMELPQ